MNEQIKQRMLEARLGPALLLHHWGKIDALTDSEQAELERMEKFALLIVRECLDQLLVSDPTEDFDKGIAWSAKQIKEHFGVEE
jgi:hypothetical protein